MNDLTNAGMSRRRFVQSATGVLTGVLSALSPLAALVPGRSWAVDMHALSAAEAATLLSASRTIVPHDGLDDAAYALVVAALDSDAAASAEAHALMSAGIASLGADFSTAPESGRVAKLKTVEAGAFFQSVRIKTLLVLYDNPIAWAHFGYQGESFSKGGYLLRGFNDLKWLPDVPIAASGPMPVA
ncbi:MAG TPA: hypothetical protein VGN77_01430 [Steroidobacteraceae bacterium]|nr:hypothetical protein [Steroidobacteraceae bacterium]